MFIDELSNFFQVAFLQVNGSVVGIAGNMAFGVWIDGENLSSRGKAVTSDTQTEPSDSSPVQTESAASESTPSEPTTEFESTSTESSSSASLEGPEECANFTIVSLNSVPNLEYEEKITLGECCSIIYPTCE